MTERDTGTDSDSDTNSDTGDRNMPIFARCHDLLRWLMPCVQDFPRAQRHLLAKRVLDTAFDVQEALVRARKVEPRTRGEALRHADVRLETLRAQWRLAHELRYISPGQYEHGARQMAEIGRMLGGWRKTMN